MDCVVKNCTMGNETWVAQNSTELFLLPFYEQNYEMQLLLIISCYQRVSHGSIIDFAIDIK